MSTYIYYIDISERITYTYMYMCVHEIILCTMYYIACTYTDDIIHLWRSLPRQKHNTTVIHHVYAIPARRCRVLCYVNPSKFTNFDSIH